MEDADGEVRFADADGAGQEQAASGSDGGIAVDEAAGHEVRGGERAVGSGKAGLVALERAVLVAGGDGGAAQEAGDALLRLALAGFDGAGSVGANDGANAHAVALWTNGSHRKVQYRRSGGVEKGTGVWSVRLCSESTATLGSDGLCLQPCVREFR